MSLTQDITNMVQAANNLTAEVAGKMAQIDQKVDTAVNAVPQAIRDNFSRKTVNIDPVNGDDTKPNGPFKTIKAAVESVPDGGIITVVFPYSAVQQIVELDTGVNIGSRKVILQGGWSGMENSGLKACILKPLIGFNESLSRSYMRGYFYGEPGGRLYLLNLKVELPRVIEGTTIEHGQNGAFISGGITVTTHHYAITGPHIYYEDGTTDPMFLLRSSGRDGKANLQDFTISYTHIQTVLAKPVIELQYGTGTLRFAYYAGTVSDKDGGTVSYSSLFSGLSYADHGYATNLLANGNILKQPA